jgi:hypothetical protein
VGSRLGEEEKERNMLRDRNMLVRKQSKIATREHKVGKIPHDQFSLDVQVA